MAGALLLGAPAGMAFAEPAPKGPHPVYGRFFVVDGISRGQILADLSDMVTRATFTEVPVPAAVQIRSCRQGTLRGVRTQRHPRPARTGGVSYC